MKSSASKSGFTLIEVLVAAMLLGMLVTILTMVFDQSAIAWRTGKAGTSRLSKARRQLSFAQNRADNLLPRIDTSSKSEVGRVLTAWDAEGNVRKRAVGSLGTVNFGMPSFSSYASAGKQGKVQPWQSVSGLDSLKSASAKTYVVGVWSYGPDGKPDTGDDITSWPGDIQ